VVQGHGDEDRADRVAGAECLLLFVPRQWWEASLVLIMLGNFCHMMFLPLLFSAVPDTVDYGLKTIRQGRAGAVFRRTAVRTEDGHLRRGRFGRHGSSESFGYKANVEQTENLVLGHQNRLRRRSGRGGDSGRHHSAVLPAEEGAGNRKLDLAGPEAEPM
jgi:hypothetical protein